MCHNLGADVSADPFTPSASIQGAKYQWGATTGMANRYISQMDDQNPAYAYIAGWNQVNLPDNTWQDAVKTANDPCPAGYRVPTSAQWQGVINNNAITRLGTWTGGYTSAIKFGPSLLLPATGFRSASAGAGLQSVGSDAYYWSSTKYTGPEPQDAIALFLSISSSMVYHIGRINGTPVRCISE